MVGPYSFSEIVGYFAEADWPLDEVDETSGRLFTSFRGRHVLVDLEVSLNLDWQLLQVTLILPEMAPAGRLPEAMAIINRINYNLPLGHFEIGPEDRQLAFYLAAPISGQVEIRPLFEAMLAWAIDIVDAEHPRLMQAIYAEAGETAFDEIEIEPRRFDA